MAKIKTLFDLESGERIYPQTLTCAVFGKDGRDLDELMDGKQDALEDSEEILVSDGRLTLADKARLRLFNDQWNTAWGKYGKYDPDNAPDPEHPYMGNEIWMTYEEAVLVMHESRPNELELGLLNKTFANRRSRTLLPLRVRVQYAHQPLTATFESCLNLEVIAFDIQGYLGMFRVSYFGESAFAWCPKLREVRGTFYIKSSTANHDGAFMLCHSLEEIRIHGLKQDISFAPCPKISLATLECLVVKAENTTAITITVHPDVYAKLTGDTSNAAASKLTQEELEEWSAILSAAAEKNITFATV